MSDFFQTGPALGNQYEGDPLLRSYLTRVLPAAVLGEIEPGLRRLGERAVGEIARLGNAAEASPPRHVPFDAWARRVDRIEVSPAWTELARLAVEERLVATAFERRHAQYSRVHQMARIYLFGPPAALYTCPLAMSDGAARCLELLGTEDLKKTAYRRLVSTDPGEAWTSGQWMTEKSGGSDVSGTETVARLEDGKYRLYGTKWFTSAVTSEMTMTLARIEGQKSLSLFFIEVRDAQGALNGIQVLRLKDKLGTRALPTAELKLEGTPALLLGGEGDGVKKIATILNITRLWNATSAASFMRRGVNLARDYAGKRRAFGKLLIDQPLHAETLAEIETETRGAFHLAFRVAELLGLDETGLATADQRVLLRLLTPLVKLYTGKQAVRIASEVAECFGGAGYIEDTGIPRLLRDSQVLAIWEGTTNVLSLDVLRAMQKEGGLAVLLDEASSHARATRHAELRQAAQAVLRSVQAIESYVKAVEAEVPETREAGARAFSFCLARTYAAGLLLAHAEASSDRGDVVAAQRWCSQIAPPPPVAGTDHRGASSELLSRP